MMSVNNRFRVWISKVFSSTVGSLALALFSVLSAGYISICSSPILAQCQALLGTAAPDTPPPDTYFHSITALSLTILALVMVGFRELGLADLALRKEAVLESQRQDMEGRLTNLPPRQFINDYVDTLREIGELRRLTKEEMLTLSPETVIKRIQTMMSGVLSLTRSWDDISASNKYVTYHANIMRIFYSDEIGISPVLDLNLESAAPEERFDPAVLETASTSPWPEHAANDQALEDDANALEQWILQFEFFLHNQSYDVAIERCSGILFIQDTELSVESQHPDKPDKDVEQICLPFTFKNTYTPGFHQPNLPGAPQAASSGQPVYVPDLKKFIAEWFVVQKSKDKEISDRYESQVSRYYQNLEHAKSLISLPIRHKDVLMGVLNISRDLENMLMNSDRAELFVQLMNPVCYHLGKMLASLEDSYSGRDSIPAATEVSNEN